MQKFIISSKTLKSALAKLGQAVSKKSVLPVLTNLLCKVGVAEVEFYTSDLELTIRYRCDCEVTGGAFQVLIPFDFLKRIASLSKEAPITVEYEQGGIRITGGIQDTFELNMLDDVETFPRLPALPKKNFIAINGSFVYWLNRAMMTVSEDSLRPAMNGVCLDVVSNGLTMASTDTHCLFTRTFAIESKKEEQLLVSPKIAKALDGFDSTEIFWNDKHIGFHSGDITIIATRIDSKYPAYRNVIPTDYPGNLSVDRQEVIEALQRCLLSMSTERSATLFLKEEKGTIRFISQDLDYNRKIQVDINGKYTGELNSICLNAERLLTLMHQVDYDKLNLAIHFANRAILITAEDDPDYLGLMMPLHSQS